MRRRRGIRYYLYGRRRPAEGEKFSAEDLATIKGEVGTSLETLWSWLDADIQQRLQ